MKMFKFTLWTSILLVVWSMAPSWVVAQDNQRIEEIPAPQESASLPSNPNAPQPAAGTLDNESTKADPSGRVARLQYMTGSVSVQPRGTEDWVEGSVNRPLTSSDNIWADKDSRAELSLGSAVLRIGAESSLTLTNVTYETVQLQLHQGSLNVHVRRLFDGEIYEIDTPNQAFTILKPGDYRFDVDTDGSATVITVRKGKGEATGNGPGVEVKSGQQVRFTGGNLEHAAYEAPRGDGFDDWCLARDKRLDNSESARYVGPGTVGSEDLDEYGTWREYPEYGHVWVPRHVVAGWSPYHYGHWVYIEPWGWTWVDDAPWGFAPFHYGRWAYVGGDWGWVPGPYYARPYYAPALVAWFGGPGWGVGWGGGWGGWGGGVGFGWCALGWREPYYPWYRGSRHYFQNVNITNTRITNITHITNNYYNNHYKVEPVRAINRDKPNGFMAAGRDTIVNSRPVAKNLVKVPANARNSAPGLRQIGLNPTRESRLGANAGQRATGAPRAALSRPTVNKLTPPAMPGRGQMQPGRPAVGDTGNRGQTPVARGPVGNGNVGNGATRIDHPNGSGTGTNGRFVPRPPSSFGNGGANRGSEPARVAEMRPPGMQRGANNNVPRPPAGANGRPMVTSAPGGQNRGSNIDHSNGSGGRGNVDRPTMNRPTIGRPQVDRSNGGRPTIDHSNGGRPNMDSASGRSSNVPRPTGPVRAAPRDYSQPSYRGSSRGESANGGGGYRNQGGYGGGYGGPRGAAEGPRGGGGGGYHPPASSGGGGPRGGGGGRPSGGGGGGHQGGGGRASSGGGGGGHQRGR